MKYGLPYKGSKNKLAERIVDFLPDGEHLIDLFCGGCAVTHRAMLCGKYPHVHINDIDWRPVRLFEDALAGMYDNEDRWISREDFFRLKDTDPYVAVVWSFGNNMRDYLYSRQIEPLKRAIHFAMFYSDYEPGRALGHDLSFIDPITDLQERYLAVKQYFRRLGHSQQQSFEGGGGRIGQLASNMPRGRTSVAGTGGGGKRPSRRLWATIAAWRYPKTPSSIATSHIKEPMFTTSPCSSTMKASMTGAAVRRNPCLSAVTKCPPTASSAFRSSPTVPRFRHRPTTRSRSASSYRGIKSNTVVDSLSNRVVDGQSNRVFAFQTA